MARTAGPPQPLGTDRHGTTSRPGPTATIRRHDPRGDDIAAKPGRPLDHALTTALLDTTLDVLAEDGLARVTADVVATRARAGTAAVYRRWATVPLLVAAAVRTCELVPAVVETGSLRSDLLTLLEPWRHPLTRCERAAAALLGHAGRHTQLDEVLEVGVVGPLATAITRIASSHGRRGPALPPQQVRLLRLVVQALWWERYTTDSVPSSADEVTELVDQVLLPVALSA